MSWLLPHVTTSSKYVKELSQTSPVLHDELSRRSATASSQVNAFENHQDYKLEVTRGGKSQRSNSHLNASEELTNKQNEDYNPETFKGNPLIVISDEEHYTTITSSQLINAQVNDGQRFKSDYQAIWQENSNSDKSFESAMSDLSFQSSQSSVSSDLSDTPAIQRNNLAANVQTRNRLSKSAPNLSCRKELEEENSDKLNPKCSMTVANEGILLVQGENIRGRPTLVLRSRDSRTKNYAEKIRSETLKQHPEWSRSYPSVVNNVPNDVKYEVDRQFNDINFEIHRTEKCEKIESGNNFNKMAESRQYSDFSRKNNCCCYNSCSSFAKYSVSRNSDDFCKVIKDKKDCSCVDEIRHLKRELQEAKVKITEFSEKMEDRSSNRNQPPEDHQRYLNHASEFTYLNHNSEEMSYPVFSQGSYNPLHQMCNSNRNAPHSYNAHPSLGRTMSYQRHSYGDCDSRVPNYDVAPNHPSCFLRKNHDDNRRRDLDSSDLVSQLAHQDPQVLASLRDQIMALQVRNLELNLFLKKEELQRKEAEEAVRRDRSYIKALEDNIQTLSTSRVVMDPLTYKQVADNYMATRKKPVRRTRTCNPYSLGSEDLVCDAQNQSFQIRKQSTSCPSSPLGSNKANPKIKESSKKRLSNPIYDGDAENLSASNERTSLTSPVELSPSTSLSFSTSSFCNIPLQKESLKESPTPCNNNCSLDESLSHSKPLNQEEYQRLLESIENLDMSAPS